MRKVYLFVFILSLAACAAAPERKAPPPEFPKDAVMFPFGYSTAFDKIVGALESEGYDVAIADRRAGVIQTYPKEAPEPSETSPVKYKGVYMIRLDGDAGRSWAIIRFALLPELPGERERLIQKLQGEGPSSP